MDLIHSDGANELYQAQSHIFKHIFNYLSSMSLKCAVQLGIPDIIHNHNQPITLQELVSELHIPLAKTSCVHRLMRMMVHSGFFAKVRIHENQQEEGYVLTPSSRLLLKDKAISLSPYVMAILDPAMVTPGHLLGDWFRGNKTSPFETAHGMGFWEYGNQNPELIYLFNEAMASDSRLMSSVIEECKPIFEGLGSLVDVGGGTGIAAKIISEAFPHMKCTVLDLPHVVADLPEYNNVTYVGGDMFHSIPSADAIFIKCVLHDWSDEDCAKILKRSREAILNKDGGGKVIIIEIVLNDKEEEHEATEAKLYFDIMMMVMVTGRERNEKEWEKLFLEAGFHHYKITPLFGLRSLIEVYP